LLHAATNAAVAVAVVLTCAKLSTYWLSGSVALLASAVDSALDASASLLNLLAVRYALKPADAGHRFGHGKSESLAGLGQAVFVGLSGVYVIWRAVLRLIDPQPLSAAVPAVVVMLGSLLLTLALVSFQRHVLRRTDSPAIKADTLHYVSDVASNVAALLALLLTRAGWVRADPCFGLVIALVTLYGALRIALESFEVLMDHELPTEARTRIEGIILAHDQVRGVHELRTRRSGSTTLIQCHLELDADTSLRAANQVAHEVSAALDAAFPGADVIIHQDPVDNRRELED
jgi:ferrous-iron efflux pump FieF